MVFEVLPERREEIGASVDGTLRGRDSYHKHTHDRIRKAIQVRCDLGSEMPQSTTRTSEAEMTELLPLRTACVHTLIAYPVGVQ